MQDLEKFLDKYYKKDEAIILACSTGPDSMYLLHQILKTKYAKNLVACYFNHKLRKEADEEEVFLENLGKELNFKVEIAEANIKEIKEKYYKSITTEELAREKRYDFFDAILHIYKTNKIITAHHLDDKIETFFFNLTRGSKISGLVNMKENNGNILRPLLNITKTQILDYLDENNLKYNIDKTNFENEYTRNKLRNEIIPQFSKVNKNYKTHISDFMNYLEEVKEMIDFEVEKFLDNNSSSEKARYFEIEKFNSLSDFLQKESIRYIFYISNGKSTIGLSSSNIDEVIRFINGKNNKTIKEIKCMKLKKDNKIILY